MIRFAVARVGSFVVFLLRHLPIVGGLIAVLAVLLSAYGGMADGLHASTTGATWDHLIHHVGRVVTLNADYEKQNIWTHAAQACAVVAAGILGLEIFRFIAGNAYNRHRRWVRRIASIALQQRQIMVIGSMPEAH